LVAVVQPKAHATTIPAQPVVIAVIGEAGFNALHRDYQSESGRPVALPPGFPRHVTVTLPSRGTFDESLGAARRGALGHLQPGVLYTIANSRVIGVINPRRRDASHDQIVDLFADTDHGTGVTSAAVGSRHGTSPRSLLVVVLGATSEAWDWAASQPWIDVVSTSYFGVGAASEGSSALCSEGRALKRLVATGRPVFSAVGNGDQLGQLTTPAGTPWVFHAGGVDAQGHTWTPVQDSGEQGSTAITPNRPYDAGELFNFVAASAFSLGGEAPFGGTSGAAPRLAGDAANVVAFARKLVHSPPQRLPGEPLVRSGPNVKLPRSGPLADGILTAAELQLVLRATASPAESNSATRYLVEGYGAVNARSVSRAEAVLSGQLALPERSDEDRMAAIVLQARQVAFASPRCA
jgi:hypothetical protein